MHFYTSGWEVVVVVVAKFEIKVDVGKTSSTISIKQAKVWWVAVVVVKFESRVDVVKTSATISKQLVFHGIQKSRSIVVNFNIILGATIKSVMGLN